MANVILTNGARLYVDHAHPEYSTPEVTNPRDVVLWDKAGEQVMAEAARRAARIPGSRRSSCTRTTPTARAPRYGSHENYLMDRKTPFIDIIRGLMPFFVTRQVFAGSGRVGIGTEGRTEGFQLSQRADFFEVEVGLETTLKRPIINTRDEPHADADKYRRLHVIIGDANLAELSTYLKVGTTSLVLAMIEAQALPRDLALEEPVEALQAISHDPSLTHLVRLRDGRRMTAIEVQRAYLEQAEKFVATRARATSRPPTCCAAGPRCSTTSPTTRCAARTGWTGRPSCGCSRATGRGTGCRGATRGCTWSTCSTPTCGPTRGCTTGWWRAGRCSGCSPTTRSTRAMTTPPADTRAFFRGECLRRYPAQVAAASWDSVVFDLGRENLVRIPTMEPLRGTREHVGALFESTSTAQELVDTITGG